jgi:opacity protein-like surface antigen
MAKVKALTVAAAGLIALPFLAHAQAFNPQPGFYVGAGGGLDWLLNSGPGNTSSSTGWAVGGYAGYDFVGPRVQLEGWYSEVPLSPSRPGVFRNFSAYGNLSVMASLLYDFMPASTITPYIGAGAGIAFVDNQAILGSTQFAYQGILGVAYNATDQLRLNLEGRYFGTTNPSGSFRRWPGQFVTSETWNNNHLQLLASISYKFVPSAPPPPAAAPPAPTAPSYMVFFDWDRSNLSAQAVATIKQASDTFKARGYARITATGHADRSGPEAYNMALSPRRANAVKDQLVRDGVPATAITVIGRGESQPLVPTADGVREPQNRRVEIVLG